MVEQSVRDLIKQINTTLQAGISVGSLVLSAGDNNIGNVDIVTVPADPFGVNADAASATGSISAKLRFIASTGIPVTSMPTTTVTATDLDIRNLTATDVVTAELGATDNAVLDAIAASVAAIDTDTTTIIGHVDGLEALIGTTNSTLSTIDADTSALNALILGTQADDIANTADGLQVTNFNMVFDGTTWDRLRGDSTNGALVNLGGNNDVTVTSGTIDLGATDNAVLDAIAASVAAIDTDATTIIGHVDGLEALIGTTNTNTGNIVTSVQLLDDTVVTLGTDTYTEATSKGISLGAVRRDADTTLVNTTNEWGPLQMDARGFLKTEIFAGETIGVSLTSTTITGTVAVTQSGTWDEVGINDSGNSITVDNGGTFATQVDGAALTALQLIDNSIVADDATFTPSSTSVNMAGFFADETATDSVDEGDGGAARMTLDRKQIVTSYPHTAGGLSTFNGTSSDGGTALTSTAQVIKASAGQIYGWYIYNPNSSAQYVQVYNTAAASVTVGTTNPLFMLTIPATSAANILSANGIEMTNAGFSCAATSTAGGNGAPTTALEAVIFYK